MFTSNKVKRELTYNLLKPSFVPKDANISVHIIANKNGGRKRFQNVKDVARNRVVNISSLDECFPEYAKTDYEDNSYQVQCWRHALSC